jgi:hypothetical protein
MNHHHSFVTRSAVLHRCKLLVLSVSSIFRAFGAFSLESSVALGLFSASSVALFTHKCVVILLHRPLGRLQLMFFWAFLFGLDIATLLLIHYALASRSRVLRFVGGITCLVIISFSATFVSVFLETNAPANWGRSVEVTLFCRMC